MTTRQRFRRLLFYFVAVVTLALAGVMLGGFLTHAVTGWFAEADIHQVHDLTLSSMLVLAFTLPIALLLYRPKARVTTVFAPIVFFGLILVFAVIQGSEIIVLPAMFGTLSLIVLLFHPAGRDILRFDRVDRINRLVAALFVVGAIPLAVYAVDQAILQLTAPADNPHLEAIHFGGMATASFYAILMGAVAATRKRDWRFAAWTAGLIVLVLGAASIRYDLPSSVGDMWGILAVLWAVVFVAAVEYSRRNETDVATPLDAETPETM